MDYGSVEQGNPPKPVVAEHPPPYENAKQDSPPSYQSIFSDLKKTKQESSGNAEFAQGAAKLCCAVLCGSVAILIILALMTAIPIAMIVMGSIHLHDCPAERYIPIYLIVGGAFGLFSSLCNMCGRAKKRNSEGEEGEEDKPGCMSGINGLVSCFLFAWFIAGNVWVYRTHGHYSEDPLAGNYCDPTLYLFAFWLITASYIIAGVILLLGICCMCGVCLMSSE